MGHSEPLRNSRTNAPVRITLVQNRLTASVSPSILGDGRLLDPLELGEPARLAVDGGPVLVTGEVVELHELGPDAVHVETDHSVYRLDFLDTRH